MSILDYIKAALFIWFIFFLTLILVHVLNPTPDEPIEGSPYVLPYHIPPEKPKFDPKTSDSKSIGKKLETSSQSGRPVKITLLLYPNLHKGAYRFTYQGDKTDFKFFENIQETMQNTLELCEKVMEN